MIYGVFFHAHEVVSFWLSDLILVASGYFRMSTFFFVSALLTAMLFERRTVSSTVRSRLIALAVPLIVSFLTLVPLAKWGQLSIALLPGDSASLSGVFQGVITFQLKGAYLHLWFLVVLILFLISAPAAHALLRNLLARDWTRRVIGSIPRRTQVLVLAAFVGLGCATSMSIFHAVLPQRACSNFLVNGFFFNYPFYLLGLAACVSYKDFQSVVRLDALAIVACLTIIVALQCWGDAMANEVKWFLKGLVNCVAAISLAATFSRFFDKPSPLLSFLSRTAYSVYLAHFTFIFCFGYFFMLSGATGGLLYALTVSTSIAACLVFHYLIVESSPLARLLYNGRWTPVASADRRQVSPTLRTHKPA